jgi:phage shock protein A
MMKQQLEAEKQRSLDDQKARYEKMIDDLRKEIDKAGDQAEENMKTKIRALEEKITELEKEIENMKT